MLVALTALTTLACINVYLDSEEDCKDSLYRVTKIEENYDRITYVGYTKLTGSKIKCHVRK